MRRIVRDRQRMTITPHAELGEMLFGQQHVATQGYFRERFGQAHSIPLRELPHTAFATSVADGRPDSGGYLDYLATSWSYYSSEENTPERRQARADRYREHVELIARVRRLQEPIRVFDRDDGRRIILDGNHRAAAAWALGLDAPTVLTPTAEALRDIARVPGEFYGAARLKMPYQSLFENGRELVRGRRPDTLTRIKMLEPGDLQNASVLELGCNIGANSFLAAEHGAAKVVGVDVSPRIASAAVRLNAYFGRPCEFTVDDLNERLDHVEPADVVFCFSVVAHLNATDELTESVRALTRRVLYFEGHSNGRAEDYRYILNPELFARIDLVGYGQNSVDNAALDRPLWRCEV